MRHSSGPWSCHCNGVHVMWRSWCSLVAVSLLYFASRWALELLCLLSLTRCCPRHTVVLRGVRASCGKGEFFLKFVSNSEITWLRLFWIQLQAERSEISLRLYSTLSTNNQVSFFLKIYFFLLMSIIGSLRHRGTLQWKVNDSQLGSKSNNAHIVLAPWGYVFSFTNIYLFIIGSFATLRHTTMERIGPKRCASFLQVGFIWNLFLFTNVSSIIVGSLRRHDGTQELGWWQAQTPCCVGTMNGKLFFLHFCYTIILTSFF